MTNITPLLETVEARIAAFRTAVEHGDRDRIRVASCRLVNAMDDLEAPVRAVAQEAFEADCRVFDHGLAEQF
jgi:hypothetical protein